MSTVPPKKTPEKKVIPMLFYKTDIENVEFVREKYGVKIAPIMRMLARKEAERIRSGGTLFELPTA